MIRKTGDAKRGSVHSAQLVTLAIALTTIGPAYAMAILPTYNDAAMLAAGMSAANIANVHTAFAAAAAQFSSNFNDSINININVTAVSGTGTLGQSSTFLIKSGSGAASFTAMQAALAGDRTTTDDDTSVLSGGSAFTTTDPIAGSTHDWWVSRAQAKAIGMLASDLSNDGTFTFGAGWTYDFDPSNGVTSGQFDFQGVAMHEIAEIMGKIAGVGDFSIAGRPAYLLFDLFRYTGPGTRGLTNGSGIQFSINAGGALLKTFNTGSSGGDAGDWASGTNDAFNAFSSSGVVNPMTAVDLRVMDVIGYNRVAAAVPEPSTGLLFVTALLVGGSIRRRAAK